MTFQSLKSADCLKSLPIKSENCQNQLHRHLYWHRHQKMKTTHSSVSSCIMALVAVSSVNTFVRAATSDISLVEFQDLLFSEVNSEVQQQSTELQDDRRLHGRFLRDDDVTPEAIDLWNGIIQHGWDVSESVHEIFPSSRRSLKSRNLTKNKTSDELLSGYIPFLVCSHSSEQMSAFSRLQPMIHRTDALLQDAIVVRNDPLKTCFHVSMQHEDAKLLRDSVTEENEGHSFTVAPMTDLMKIQVDSLSMIYEDSWSLPKKATEDEWERLVRVGLSVGHRMNLDAYEVNLIAKDIIDDILSLSSKSNSRRSLRKNSKDASSKFASISDTFSLTAIHNSYDQETRRLRKGTAYADANASNRWRRALEEGLEQDHSCEVMFEKLTLNAHYDNKGFDIVLNPTITSSTTNDKYNDGIEKECEKDHTCTASNNHCVASFVIALSTHPLILSIETESQVIADDYESQWITQTKSIGNRPLRDIGINGKDQVISIIDSGLDINHKYFGPTDGKVFEVSLSQHIFCLCFPNSKLFSS